MKSQARNILIGLLAIIIISFASFYYAYYISMQEANEKGKQMKCKEFIEQSFFGTITKIERFEDSDFMNKNFFALSIKTNDSLNKFIDYQFNLEPNKNILAFAKVGQLIFKHKNKDTFELIDHYEKKRTYKLPFCN